jgi:hypothetical protein
MLLHKVLVKFRDFLGHFSAVDLGREALFGAELAKSLGQEEGASEESWRTDLGFQAYYTWHVGNITEDPVCKVSR